MGRLQRGCSQLCDFDWKSNCFLCGETIDIRHPNRNAVRRVLTMEIKSSLLNDCKTFPTPWSNDVHARLLDCHDPLSSAEVL